jgi:hypothetical protein
VRKFLIIAFIVLMSVLIVSLAVAQRMSHKDFSKLPLTECNNCHEAEGIARTHDNEWAGKHHQSNDWLSEHRVLASKASRNCEDCHEQAFCLDCHRGGGVDLDPKRQNFQQDYVPKTHRSDFINIHPIKAKDNPQSCKRCHEVSFCADCHDRFPKGALRIKSHMMLGPNGQRYAPALNEHAIEARRNLQSCQACHPEGDVCIQCHASGKTNPHPRNWGSISGNFKDRAGSRVCRKCHLPGTY